ncbi:hypothetical protein BH11PSE11_BH11PSE11_04520 [soil metagenome]
MASYKKLLVFAVGIAMLACLFAYSEELAFHPPAPTRAGPPPKVAVPADISAFLDQLGNAYGSDGFAEVGSYLSSDFLYQGMNREGFLHHLRRHQKYLGKLVITPISIESSADAVRIVAFAVSPRGVVAPSMQLLPLNIGGTLVKEGGAWKLRGNQSHVELPLYRKLSSVTADFAPSDIETYKSLVPVGYELPEAPYVRVSVSNWLAMEPPQTPYRLVALSILVRKNKENFWYIVSMPETDWVAVKAGNAVGFPKFVTEIDLDRSLSNHWTVAVRQQANPLIDVRFEPGTDAQSYLTRKVDAWLLVDQEKSEVRAWMTAIGTPAVFRQAYGWMTVDTKASPWKELVAPGSRAAAVTVDLTGGLKLNMEPLAGS